MSLITTEDGNILLTQSGYAIGTNDLLANDAIQAFDFSVDLLQTILWEYNEATRLQALINSKQAWYDTNQEGFWQSWLTDVFDLRTANQFGLAVWGIILGLPLYVSTPAVTKPTFGFGGSGGVNFDNGNFTDTNGSTYVFSIATQRMALQLRYLQLIGSGTVPEINRALKRIFSDLGSVYLLDYGNMKQEYIFRFPVSAELNYLFNNYDILPRPSGVRSTFTDATQRFFGFAGSNGFNFDNGNFGS